MIAVRFAIGRWLTADTGQHGGVFRSDGRIPPRRSSHQQSPTIDDPDLEALPSGIGCSTGTHSTARELGKDDSTRLFGSVCSHRIENAAGYQTFVPDDVRCQKVWWCRRLIRPLAAAQASFRRHRWQPGSAKAVCKCGRAGVSGNDLLRIAANRRPGPVQPKTTRELNAFPCGPFWP